MSPTTLLHTEIGRVEATPTDGGHIHVGSRALNVDPLIVNGVEYYLSAHLWKTTNGVFSTRDYKDLHMSRAGLKDVSAPARKKAERVIVTAVNTWLAKNPTVLIEAEAAHLSEQVRARRAKIADLRTQIAALEAEITDLADETITRLTDEPRKEP